MLEVLAAVLALVLGLLACGVAGARAVVRRCEADLKTGARDSEESGSKGC